MIHSEKKRRMSLKPSQQSYIEKKILRPRTVQVRKWEQESVHGGERERVQERWRDSVRERKTKMIWCLKPSAGGVTKRKSTNDGAPGRWGGAVVGAWGQVEVVQLTYSFQISTLKLQESQFAALTRCLHPGWNPILGPRWKRCCLRSHISKLKLG